jgi:hypothetical protein
MFTRRLFSYTLAASAAAAGAQVALPEFDASLPDSAAICTSASPVRNAMLSDVTCADHTSSANPAIAPIPIAGRAVLQANQSFASVI